MGWMTCHVVGMQLQAIYADVSLAHCAGCRASLRCWAHRRL